MGRALTTRRSSPGVRRIARYFWPPLLQQGPLVLGSLGALLLEVALQLLEPWPLKLVLDHVIASPRRAWGVPLVDALDPIVVLTLLAVGLVAVTGLRALASYANTVGFALVGNHVLTEVRSRLYRHLQYLSLSFHTRARSGELALRVMSDVSTVNDVAVTAILPLAASFFVLFGMLGLMWWMHWQLALLALVTAPLFWIRTVKLSREIQEASRKQRQRDGAMAATAVESIGAIKIVQALSLERMFSETFSSANARSLRAGVRASRLSASLERSVDLFIAVSTALVLWFGSRLVLDRTMSAGDLIVFLAYLKSAFRPAKDFAKYTGRLAKARAAAERVVDRSHNVASAGNHALADPGPSPEPAPAQSDLAVPTLVIHGTEDPLFPLPHGQALARLIPGAELLVVDGMGHELPRWTWDTTVPAILAHTAAADRAVTARGAGRRG
jgi:ATP-binding cassette subfamily B protein